MVVPGSWLESVLVETPVVVEDEVLLFTVPVEIVPVVEVVLYVLETTDGMEYVD